VVLRIDREFVARFVVVEDLRLDVEVLEAEERIGGLVEWEEEREAVNGSAAPEIVDPDERVR